VYLPMAVTAAAAAAAAALSDRVVPAVVLMAVACGHQRRHWH
jgi:hypothetical protein